MDHSNLLKSLEQHSYNTAIGVHVPSVGRIVKFKLITAKQHKDILTTVVDRVTSGLSFNVALNTIIQDNCLEKIQLLVTDKPLIAVALRVHSISPIFNGEDMSTCLTPENTERTNENDCFVETEDVLKIKLKVPSLAHENKIYNETITRSDTSNQNLKSTMGDIYIHEVLKYIESIQFKGAETTETVQFKDVGIAVQRLIVEKLPFDITNNIIKKITEFKDNSQKFFQTADKKVIDLTIDQSFFTV